MFSKYGYVEIDGIPIDIDRLPIDNIQRYIEIKKEQRQTLIDDKNNILTQYIKKNEEWGGKIEKIDK